MKPASSPRRRRLPLLAATLMLVLSLPSAPGDAARPQLKLGLRTLELPGAPSVVLPADLNGDGRQDLVIVVAFTEWDQISEMESTEMDAVEGLVEVLTVIPSLVERRELRVFLAANEEGGYSALPPLPLDLTVLSVFPGPTGIPIAVLTDEGVSRLELVLDQDPPTLRLTPLVQATPVLAGTEAFVPNLKLTHDLDGDRLTDLAVPGENGIVLFANGQEGLAAKVTARVPSPHDHRTFGTDMVSYYAMPEVRDVTGDGLPDLLFPHPRDSWDGLAVVVNGGSWEFETPIFPALPDEPEPIDGDSQENREEGAEDEAEEEAPEEILVHFGDLNGDGLAEAVSQTEMFDDDAGMRKSIQQAKRPPFLYNFYPVDSRLNITAQPRGELLAEGYAFAGDDEVRLPGGFQDLNGDERLDLVTLTLDFSLFQAIRILATKSLSLGLDFHIWCQQASGDLLPVTGLDLSGKLRLNLNNLKLGHLSQFAGDFDGDGLSDFVQMGRGRKVTIHKGRENCSYPAAPDLSLELSDAPRNLALVQVRDLDGDDLADLLIIQPQMAGDAEVTARVRLDLYLSGATP